MTSRIGTAVAPPAWGARGAKASARAEASEHARESLERARVGERRGTARIGVFAARRPALELRVSAPRTGVVGVALALGFALLWAFLLIGVAGPASAL